MMLPEAFGTQTVGFVVRSATYCGMAGYKSSQGKFSLEGIFGLAQSLDSLGFFVREVDDPLLLREVFLGSVNQHEDTSAILRVGLVRATHWSESQTYQRNLLENVCDRLSYNTCEVNEVEVGRSDGALSLAQATVMEYESSRSLVYEYESHPQCLSEQITELIASGREKVFDENLKVRPWRKSGGESLR